MNWTPRLGPRTLAKLDGFPDDALEELARVVGNVCRDPYDVLHSEPVGGDTTRRLACLGDDAGFVYLKIDEYSRVVTVTDVVWVG